MSTLLDNSKFNGVKVVFFLFEKIYFVKYELKFWNYKVSRIHLQEK